MKFNHLCNSSSDFKVQNFGPFNSKTGNQKLKLTIYCLWRTVHSWLNSFHLNTLAEKMHAFKKSKTITFHTFHLYQISNNLSVMRQKGKFQNGCFKKTKHAKFSKKTNISYPLIRTRFKKNGKMFLQNNKITSF